MTTVDEGKLDSAVVAALYFEHAEELRAFLIGLLRSSDLAGEALQTTFLKTMLSGHTAREETRKGWLFRVAFNEAMAIRRRRKLQNKTLNKLVWVRPAHARSGEKPERNVIRWETVDRVRQALKTLPAEQRRVVQMRIYEEKTFAVIARELSLPLGTVLTRMRLALRKLSGKLDSEE